MWLSGIGYIIIYSRHISSGSGSTLALVLLVHTMQVRILLILSLLLIFSHLQFNSYSMYLQQQLIFKDIIYCRYQ